MNLAQALSLRTTLLRLNRTIHELDILVHTEGIDEPVFYWDNRPNRKKKALIAECSTEIRRALRCIAGMYGIEIQSLKSWA